MTLILNLIFRRGRVTKILNFGFKIKGGGSREGGTSEVLHPATPQNLKRAPGPPPTAKNFCLCPPLILSYFGKIR